MGIQDLKRYLQIDLQVNIWDHKDQSRPWIWLKVQSSYQNLDRNVWGKGENHIFNGYWFTIAGISPFSTDYVRNREFLRNVKEHDERIRKIVSDRHKCIISKIGFSMLPVRTFIRKWNVFHCMPWLTDSIGSCRLNMWLCISYAGM